MQESQPQPILENLWWVIPGKLAGVRKPTSEEIAELKTAGIGAIVSVMDDPSNLDLYERANITHCWLPTKGGTAPTQEQIQDLRNFVDQQHQNSNAVAVHCTSGNCRTGTMLAAYLFYLAHLITMQYGLFKPLTRTLNCERLKLRFCDH